MFLFLFNFSVHLTLYFTFIHALLTSNITGIKKKEPETSDQASQAEVLSPTPMTMADVSHSANKDKSREPIEMTARTRSLGIGLWTGSPMSFYVVFRLMNRS